MDESEVTPIFVSVDTAAQMLGLTRWTVYALCREGVLPSQFHGRRRLIRPEHVRAYADSLPTEREVPAS